MAVEIGIGMTSDSEQPFFSKKRIILNDDGYYWFLHRYFERAKERSRDNLIDLYGDSEIEGHELLNLEKELNTCLSDIESKKNKWAVLTGWKNYKAKGNAIYHDVEKMKVRLVIQDLLSLIHSAKSTNVKIICIGD